MDPKELPKPSFSDENLTFHESLTLFYSKVYTNNNDVTKIFTSCHKVKTYCWGEQGCESVP
jgi:hypothetical protein